MKAGKIYRKLIPVSTYDIAGMESWLSDMAEKGLFLCDFGNLFAKFTKGAPKSVRYRLEPVGGDNTYLSAELKDLYEENGWRYIASLGMTFYVFLAEDASSPEIHTDPVVQSQALKKTARQLHISLIVLIALTVFLTGFTLFMYAAGGNWVRHVLLGLNSGIYVAALVLLFAGLYLGISDIRISRLRRRLLSGRPFEHRKSRKRAAALKITELAARLSPAIMLVLLIVNGATDITNLKPLTEAPRSMPVLSLAEIDPGQYANYSGGYYYRGYSPLVPAQYTVLQNIKTDDPYDNPTVLQTDYYKAAFSGLARSVYDEQLRVFIEIIGHNADYDTLDTPLFDGSVYTKIDNAQYIIAYRDKTVVVVRYEGDADLRDKLPLIADTFF
jgi:hypothetical protein